ncbi:MAG: type II secretion system protein GspE, partial [Hellea sp.]|nr:type II secretion system protein GspE [Hellea sp.]
ECHQIGYIGRLGLYEVVIMDDILRGMIHDGSREVDMSAHAFRVRNDLLKSGSSHVLSGLTSAEEVLRVCRAKADPEVEV